MVSRLHVLERNDKSLNEDENLYTDPVKGNRAGLMGSSPGTFASRVANSDEDCSV